MKRILVIYTGGTIGMVKDKKTGTLLPFDMSKIYEALPVLREFNCELDSYRFDPIIDSSNMKPDYWIGLVNVIESNYEKYDSFIVLHGTDTMSYTASALSFMLENLAKPVILTGSQLPLGMIRTDGRENIIGAVEIASNENLSIPEVCIFFEDRLYRGNRTTKINAEYFEAFYSGNYPSLAKVGINITYKQHLFLQKPTQSFKTYKKLDDNIILIKLFPGIKESYLRTILSIEGLKGVVLETYGSGNAPTEEWFIDALKTAIDNGIIIYNVTQCKAGSVAMGHYETSAHLAEIGVISGHDITTESAVAKLMFLHGNYDDKNKIVEMLNQPLRGELSI
ncbi:MAG: asparaginase [Bacteroidales bacterium]|jgi:L-asparaginase|nr:asparaginase [Bacteroidales bacterium]MDD4703673.1 asparaginase [Bacteroidales bacterium]MDX9798360.1 asparaginase [Bacteroidales bacterium]